MCTVQQLFDRGLTVVPGWDAWAGRTNEAAHPSDLRSALGRSRCAPLHHRGFRKPQLSTSNIHRWNASGGLRHLRHPGLRKHRAQVARSLVAHALP